MNVLVVSFFFFSFSWVMEFFQIIISKTISEGHDESIKKKNYREKKV